MRISPQYFYKHLTCPHWIWFDVYGDQRKKGELSELQQKLLEQGVAHEAELIKGYKVFEVTFDDPEEAFLETLRLMRSGAPLIYQGYLLHQEFVGRPDLLERRDLPTGASASKFGRYYYVPVDIKSSKDIKDEHKYQLTLYSLVLAEMQGVKPPEAGIITINGERKFFEIASFEKKFHTLLGEIKKILAGEKPAPVLTKKCLESPWAAQCVALAEDCDDIALLYKVERRSLATLRERGVRTVEAVRGMNIDALDGAIPYLKRNGLERMKMQAESLKTGQIFVRREPKIKIASLSICFDIEGDPLLGVEYLFGFLIERDGRRDEYKEFVAEAPSDEEKMWREFLSWVETLPDDYIVYHYATYEKSRLTMLQEKYGGSTALKKFQERLFDLNTTIKECFVFPLYFYGLKDVVKFLEKYTALKKPLWRSKKAGGAQSIFWYEEWLKTGDRKILATIIDYNEDDVRATKFLKDWIEKGRKKTNLT